MTQSPFSAFPGLLGDPLVLRIVSLEPQKSEQLMTNWSLDAVKAGLTNTGASEVQAGGIGEGWRPREDCEEDRSVQRGWPSVSAS